MVTGSQLFDRCPIVDLQAHRRSANQELESHKGSTTHAINQGIGDYIVISSKLLESQTSFLRQGLLQGDGDGDASGWHGRLGQAGPKIHYVKRALKKEGDPRSATDFTVQTNNLKRTCQRKSGEGRKSGQE